MEVPPKKLLVTGDRVLIAPEEGEERTKVGLYLPATAIDTQQVQEGMIVATGPGDPIPMPSTLFPRQELGDEAQVFSKQRSLFCNGYADQFVARR